MVIRNRKSKITKWSSETVNRRKVITLTKRKRETTISTAQKTKQLKTKNKSKQIIMYLSNEVRLAIVVLGFGGIKGTLLAKQ